MLQELDHRGKDAKVFSSSQVQTHIQFLFSTSIIFQVVMSLILHYHNDMNYIKQLFIMLIQQLSIKQIIIMNYLSLLINIENYLYKSNLNQSKYIQMSNGLLLKQNILSSIHQNVKILKAKQEQYAYQAQLLHKTINSKLSKFKHQLSIKKQQIQTNFTQYQNCIENDSVDSQLISISELGKYLQQQKLFLKKQISQQNTQQNIGLLHNIVTQKRLENILLSLNEYQLQEEIKYLKNEILLGNIINYDLTAPTTQQQNDLKSNITKKLEQLERVTNLSVICGKSSCDAQKKQLKQLSIQKERLQQVGKLLENQNKEVQKINSFVTELSEMLNNLPISQKLSKNDNNSQNILSHQQCNFEDQINTLLSYQMPKFKVINSFQQNNQSIEQKLNKLRKKMRKIQAWKK